MTLVSGPGAVLGEETGRGAEVVDMQTHWPWLPIRLVVLQIRYLSSTSYSRAFRGFHSGLHMKLELV